VSLNSVTFRADNQSGNTFYDDTTSTLFNAPLVWSVTGGNNIPAFTHTFTVTRPAYTGWTSIPDTIKKANGFSFNVTGLSSANEILVSISSSSYITKSFAGNTSAISFSSSELNGLAASSSALMILTFSNGAIENAGGTNFKFKTGYEVFKQIVVQ